MNKNKKIIIIVIAIGIFYVTAAIFGLTVQKVMLDKSNKYFEEIAEPYFSENAELEEEVGKIKSFECYGRAPKAEQDGLPVCYMVHGEKGDYYVVLWIETVNYETDQREVTKHLVTTTLPDLWN